MKKGILERLKEGVVLGDGGYLLELEKRGWVRAGPFTPEVALTNPQALRELHIEFREAGADVLQALTFYASRDKLATVGLENRLADLNRAAVRIAKEVAGDRCVVAGNLSLTWMYEPNDKSSARSRPQTFRRATRSASQRRNRFRNRRNVLVSRRSATLRRTRQKNRPAGNGNHVLRNGSQNPRRKIASRMCPRVGRRRRRHHRHQLPTQPATHAPANGRNAQSGQCVSGLPTGSLSHHG